MEAVLANYRGKKVLTIFYNKSDTAASWSEIIEAGREYCGVSSDQNIAVVCIPIKLREVINGK